jgi:hypothetical protein
MSDDAPKLSDVTWTRFVINITQALSDRIFRWTALCMAFAVTGVAMFRPMPFWSVIVGGLFVALLSPLWLRKDRGD